MPYLKLSVELLDQTYHGCGDGGTPEWPPSPLRVYQSLVASAARGQMIGEDWERALNWLAAQAPPMIVAPPTRVGTPYRASVPNNAMDIVAKAWSRGNETGKDAQPSTHKAMKTIRPTYLQDGSRVFYLWQLDQEPGTEVFGHIERLRILARQLVALGWGLDLVVGNLEAISDNEMDELSGERWIPSTSDTHLLRMPHEHTLPALQNRHAQFERRFREGSLTPVPQLSPAAFRRVAYLRDWEPVARPVAAFRLLQLDGEQFRIFSMRRACSVAGMLRHITATTARETGWAEDWINSFVLGHGESREDSSHQPVGRERFAFVPLPSLEKRQKVGSANVVGPIRRALLFVPEGGPTDAIEWAKRNLPGQEILSLPNQNPEALIARAVRSEYYRYVEESATWATVTPVVLPGRDDRRQKKTEQLLRKAIVQAGYSETLAKHALIEFRNVGYFPRADLASRYFVPKYLLSYPRCHVRITWCAPNGGPVKIPGPLVLGGGRYAGLGLFASDPQLPPNLYFIPFSSSFAVRISSALRSHGNAAALLVIERIVTMSSHPTISGGAGCSRT